MRFNRTLGLTLVAAALMTAYGCGKEEPKKAAEAPGPRRPRPKWSSRSATSGRPPAASRTWARTTRTAPAWRSTTPTPRASRSAARRSSSSCVAEDDAGRPEAGHRGRAEAGRREGQRRHRPPELGHHDSGLEDLQRRRHSADLAVGDESRSTRGRASRPRSASSPTTTQQGGTLGATRSKQLKGKKIAMIDDRTAYGQGVAEEFEKAAKAAGGTIVAHEYTTDKATDFKAILTKIKAEEPGPDLLRRHGRARRPDDAADEAARHQGQVHRRRRHLHRPSCQARRRRGRRASTARRPAFRRKRWPTPRTSSTRFTAKYGPIQVYAPYLLRRAMT